jgi:hypothetical protein
MTISPEHLAAYADGELDPEAVPEVEAEIAADPKLQADLAAHRALRAKLAAHFAPIAKQPVPNRLRQAALVEDSAPSVIDFAAEAQRRRTPTGATRWTRFVGPALAASLVLALLGYGLRPSDERYASGELSVALERQLVATQPANAPVRILLTVRDEKGEYCRGFSGKAQSGLACRDDRGWRLIKTFGGASGSSSEYRQAGSADAAVMTAMQNLAAGSALDATEEGQAASRGWRVRHSL